MFWKKGFILFACISILSGFLLLNNGCRKDQFGNGGISFSTDTLTFDTVFTSLGSTTKYFKVFNTSKKAVNISNIRLMHLVGTQFRINVSGRSGDSFTDMEIPAKDSIYVFVEVTVNPNSAATPFVIIDDVSFIVNGNASTVHLQAFGQNAHFHYGEEITAGQTKTWSNDLPHVIISHDSVPGVLVDCGATLNINPGCKIFFAGNSAIFVQGTLNAPLPGQSISWSDSIVFQGARLEQYYQDKPGQWFGIVFLRDTNNTTSCAAHGNFSHCVVNESSYGIYAGAGLTNDLSKFTGTAGRPVIQINNTIVKNSQYNAVYGFNAKITATNSIFNTAGEYLIKLGLGGNYTFTHCTMFNNGSPYISHDKESLLLSNFVSDGTNIYPEPLKTTFTNCLLYGNLQNEISFNNAEDTLLTNFDNAFSYCDVKSNMDTFNMFTNIHDNVLINQEPGLQNPGSGDFIPSDSTGYISPLIDYAPAPNGGLSIDIYDKLRPVSKTSNLNKYDVGAIEVQ